MKVGKWEIEFHWPVQIIRYAEPWATPELEKEMSGHPNEWLLISRNAKGTNAHIILAATFYGDLIDQAKKRNLDLSKYIVYHVPEVGHYYF